MKIIAAPDSYKGSMTAAVAAAAITKGVHRAFPAAEVIRAPLSDGGEGLVSSLIDASGGRFLEAVVTGPLGEPVKACWGLLGDGSTAVIEMAAASGLTMVQNKERNPLISTTYGTGELIKLALNEGCRKIILGLGGSATNDGGAGMAQALGASLIDQNGVSLPYGGAALADLDSIKTDSLDSRLASVEVLAACDVNNPLTGKEGASAVFGPQKGAQPAMVDKLDQALGHYAEIIRRDLGKSVESVPGSGAAGGLGAGVLAFLNARLVPGIDLVLDTIDLEKELPDCNLVLTGEGRFDAQSAFGKVPVGLARRAKKYHVPVIVIAGSVAANIADMQQEGVTACFSMINEPMTLEDAIARGELLLQMATFQLVSLYFSK
jgi:glycerate 2-kinase